ncbi:MAG TPA: tannase/feruloyl esterase family alpha/beta hydrolase [Solirubrobacteraceae bacterium]|jgi:feruloyl esterase|nr:tannase/feruloyl esterase family alpha/beta hydrolase [Solirubrobacteraceae bacterium]
MRGRGLVTVAATGAAFLGVVVAIPAQAHQPAPKSGSTSQRGHDGQGSGRSSGNQGSGQNDGTQIANLPVIKSKELCSTLADTTMVDGQSVQIAEDQVASSTPGGPLYCALTGTINTNVGFEVLLPVSTWRQRYLQIGCGGTCGSIGLSAPQTTDYAPLADGDFVVASQDEGHSGQSTAWYSNGAQRVDFAYLSDHLLAEVSKGLADEFYGIGPKYSYFDGCSQGGHQALTEVQRYPKDFNGVLAGAPASIMTELNSVLHEYEYDAALNESGQPIISEQQANLVGNAAMVACYPSVGLMLDYRACEDKFNIKSLECSATLTTNCLTAAQIAAFEQVYAGPEDLQGQKLYPGGYPLGSEFNWDNGTSVNIPATLGTTPAPATFITSWLQYFAFETDIGAAGVANEPFTAQYFHQIEKLAPFWDATNPDISAFDKAGGKLILWQGEADWSIPTISSIAYYQAVVKANGGISATQQFARYYLLPSVGHCGGNGPDTYNGLGAVVQWTELHQAPNSLTATQYAPAVSTGSGPGGPGGTPPTSDLTDAVPTLAAPATTAVVRTLPLYPYPELPAYNGTGNVDSASSYHGQVSRAVQKPTPWLGKFDTLTTWCNAQGVDCFTTGSKSRPWAPQTHKHRI